MSTRHRSDVQPCTWQICLRCAVSVEHRQVARVTQHMRTRLPNAPFEELGSVVRLCMSCEQDPQTPGWCQSADNLEGDPRTSGNSEPALTVLRARFQHSALSSTQVYMRCPAVARPDLSVPHLHAASLCATLPPWMPKVAHPALGCCIFRLSPSHSPITDAAQSVKWCRSVPTHEASGQPPSRSPLFFRGSLARDCDVVLTM